MKNFNRAWLYRLFAVSGLLFFLTRAIMLGAEDQTEIEYDNSHNAVDYPHPLRRNIIYADDRGIKPGARIVAARSSLLDYSSLNMELTLHYIDRYSSPSGLEWLRASMERGAPFLAFIQKEIEELNLPAELIYLPIIESEYLPGAVSQSGAAGLWQFMKNSVAPFGININDWVDERRDFWKSTQGALRKLQENYAVFNDWPLALAAYNAGLGSISNLVKNTGIKDYWTLSGRRLLKTETIHYVPKLLAAAYILSNPRKYGLVLWPEDPQWVRIPVNRSIDINMLARESWIDPVILKKGNQELLYNITPPGNHLLKIRSQDLDRVLAVLARTDLPLVSYYIHTIRSGDTLLAIALHYGITVDHLMSVNPGIQPRLLRLGSTLMVPAIREQAPMSSPNRNSGVNFTGSHQVTRGETLWSIARLYGTDPETLAEANNMRLNDVLREGRVLKTPIME